jgi:hypothetical protein
MAACAIARFFLERRAQMWGGFLFPQRAQEVEIGEGGGAVVGAHAMASRLDFVGYKGRWNCQKKDRADCPARPVMFVQ